MFFWVLVYEKSVIKKVMLGIRTSQENFEGYMVVE
jgi:hypothetical protein